MRNLRRVFEECCSELDAINIPYGNVKEIVPNARAQKRWGQCKRNYDGTYSINISTQLLEDSTPINGLKNTIIHELIHTCPECFNHRSKWKSYADKVNQRYGYDIKRCESSNEKGIDPFNTSAKYVYRCVKCGTIYTRMRATNFTRHPENYRCGVCNGKLETLKG